MLHDPDSITWRLSDLASSSTGARIELQLFSIRSEAHDHIWTTNEKLDRLQQQMMEVNQRIDALGFRNEGQLACFPRRLETRQDIRSSIHRGPQDSVSPTYPMVRGPPWTTNSLVRSRRSMCFNGCRCRCHIQRRPYRRWELSPSLRFALGSLCVGYTESDAQPYTTCNSTECLETTARSDLIDVTYTFPPWILRYAMNLIINKSATALPTVVLSFRQRIDHEFGGVIYAAVVNNIELLKAAFKKHPSVVNAVDAPCGRTPLWYALSRGHVEAAQFLLRVGASLDILDDRGISPGMYLASEILTDTYPAEKRKLLCELVPVAEYIDDLELPPLAYIAINGTAGQAESLLAACPKTDIDEHDRLGQTPLHWAVRCGNLAVAEELIVLGADPSARDHQGRNPLHYSLVRGLDPSIFDLLVRHGAPLTGNDTSSNGMSPFHIACINGRVDAIEVMLRGDHRVDVKSLYSPEGVTALHLATWGQHPETVHMLLDHGADMFLQKKCGDSTLHVAVYHNAHGCLRALLGHLRMMAHPQDNGQRMFTKPEEQTILHYAARVGDLETLTILAEGGIDTLRNAGILGPDTVAAKNADGSTPEEVFMQRRSESPDIQTANAFASLVEILTADDKINMEPPEDRLQGGDQNAEHDGDEKDEFHDALTDL